MTDKKRDEEQLELDLGRLPPRAAARKGATRQTAEERAAAAALRAAEVRKAQRIEEARSAVRAAKLRNPGNTS